MSNVYIIENTAGTLSITLNPGGLNGPGSLKRDTDLRLYGMGSISWGKGVDENFLRITENFACPAKILGDYNPDTELFDYDPETMPVLPRDERDMGPGKGINKPIDGQQWFNTSSRSMYIYDAILETGSPPTITGGWKSAAGIPAGDVPPENPQTGDTWYYIDPTTGVGGGMDTGSGYPELMIYNPDHPEANEDGWVSVLVDYVSEYGGEKNGMKGDLYMTDDITNDPSLYHQIKYLADPVDPYDAVNLHYMEEYVTGITTVISQNLAAHEGDDDRHLTATQGSLLDALTGSCITSAAAAQALAADLCYIQGISSGQGDIYDQLETKANRAGDTFTGNVIIPATTAGTPSNAAVTKGYIDAELSSATDTGDAARFTRTFTSIAASDAVAGDIAVVAGVIYIHNGATWKQVFPAIYS